MTTTSAPPGVRLRVHQREALVALAAAWAAGRTRAWVALPPGAGKTLVGLVTVRDRIASGAVGRAVVLGPNTAIQGQWAFHAAALGLDVGTDRSLSSALTALTYQAVAVFDPDDEVDDDGQATDPTVAEVRGAPAAPVLRSELESLEGSLEASAAGAGSGPSRESPGFDPQAQGAFAPQPPSV